MAQRREQGEAAEQRARRHLESLGLRFVRANYQCRRGEIDLIMRERDTLVFVEVRQRRHTAFGGALASVTHAKQRRIILTAQHYLQRMRLDAPVRFDVVAIEADRELHWIRDAFRADGYD